MADENIIPAVWAAGRFEAITPFDAVVDPNIFYTVEESRTINKMQADKINLYSLIFEPLGVSEDDYGEILEKALTLKMVVLTLTSQNGPPVYVFSNYLKSFPLIDGVIYERICLVADLGPCNPKMKDTVLGIQEHMRDYIFSKVGINASVKLGTIPIPGYVSQAQDEINENARRANITNTQSDQARIIELERLLSERDNYVVFLESQLQP